MMEDRVHDAVQKHFTKRDCSKECIEMSKVRMDIRELKKALDDKISGVDNRFKWGVIFGLIFAIALIIAGMILIHKENLHDSKISAVESSIKTYQTDTNERIQDLRNDMRQQQAIHMPEHQAESNAKKN